jgi:hypothetical protein
MVALTLAARDNKKACTIDITGAYLNAKMAEQGGRVYMSLDPTLSSIALQLLPEYIGMVDSRGMLLLRLDKALYGCVQSARLWFDELSATLESLGYTPAYSDPCAFYKVSNGTRCDLIIFVDDIVALCDDESFFDDLVNGLERRYPDVKAETSQDFCYLGMHVVLANGKATIGMEGYVQDLLQEWGVRGTRNTPATSTLFDASEGVKLTGQRAEVFHSVVAKVLYLATKIRPDLLVSVAYLCSRVTSSTEGDEKKLYRLLQYLNGTQSKCLVLSASDLKMTAFVDASFGMHGDGKSHTGICIMLGEGCVLAKSAKQRIVTKDSTEAELVALSDMVSVVERCHELVVEMGYNIPPPVIMQDNASTITLVTVGGGAQRTRHMRVRQHLVLERVTEGKVSVIYTPTGNMLADVLTKPLQGELYRTMTYALLNCRSAV